MSDRIIEILNKQPLAAAIAEIMKAESAPIYQEQIAAIEQQLAGDVPPAARRPLTAALEQLHEAQRQANLPLQAQITKAIAEIMRSAGLVAAKRPQAIDGTRKMRRPRLDADALCAKVLAALPQDLNKGLPGKVLAKECGVSYQTLRGHLNSIQDQGLIVRQGHGPGTTWHRLAKPLDK